MAKPQSPEEGAKYTGPRNPSVAGMDDAAQGFFERLNPNLAPEPEPTPGAEDVGGADSTAPAADAVPDVPVETAAEPSQEEAPAPDSVPVEEAVDQESAPEQDAQEGENEDLVVEVHGEQLSVSELTSGYMRQRDYTQKTQELANQRREVEAAAAQLQTQTQQEQGRLAQLNQALDQELQRIQAAENAEIERLRVEDPGTAALRIQERDRRNQLLSFAQQEQARVLQEQQNARIPQERAALQQRIPAFAKDFQGEYAQLGEYAVSPEGGGLSPEEWNTTFDHRHVALVWKAMQYDKATRAKPRVTRTVAAKPKVVRPGARPVAPSNPEAERVAAANARLEESGSLDDAAAAFLARDQAKRGGR